MSPTALLLVLFASLGWAGLDALRKALGHRMRAEAVIAWLMGAQGLCFFAWAVWDGIAVPAAYLGPGLVILALNIVSNTLFIRAVQASPLSLTIPFLSFTPVFTALMAVPILGEHPTPRQGLGIAVVVVGALTLAAGRAEGQGGIRGIFGAALKERGSVMMLGVSLIWSVVAPLDKRALTVVSLPTHAALQTVGMSVSLSLLLTLRGQGAALKEGWRHRRLVAAAAGIAGISLALQLTAYSMTLVSLVEAVKRGVGLLLAVAQGRLFFGEEVTLKKVAAVALMAGGSALILL